MKTLAFTNADNTVNVEYLTDIIGSNDYFTIYEITGLTDALQALYVFPDKVTQWTLAEAAAFGVSSNLTLKVYETDETTVTEGSLVAMVISDVALDGATNDTVYTEQIHADGGNGDYVYTVADLPTGLSINAATGAITGTPLDTVKTHAVTFTVTDAFGVAVSKALDIVLGACEKTDFLTYSFPEQSVTPVVIDTGAHTIDIEVVNGTTVTALVATFTMDYLALADISDVAQTSGVTDNNFTEAVTYTVTAEDGVTEQDWVITVSIAAP